VLWILRTGTQWRELPEKYPPFQTVHGRFLQWVRRGQLENVLRVLAGKLHEQNKLDLGEGFIDGSFAAAQKGGLATGKTKRGKETKIMAITAGSSVPLAVTAIVPHVRICARGEPEGSCLSRPEVADILR
jgi:transposase